MRIGYACLAVGVPHTDMKSCMKKNVSMEKLSHLIAHNLESLDNLIGYNIKSGISLFRISSDLIPFGSSSVNTLSWQQIFCSRLEAIGQKITNSGMRVSMHPGQYTVLNSPKPEVVQRAVDDLHYHAFVLDSMGLSLQHKIVLHIGGGYGDKKTSKARFLAHCAYLDASVMQRLVLENDDRVFHIEDVLETGHVLGLPVVYDHLHNTANPCGLRKHHEHWITCCKETWKPKDGCQKIHYSQQDQSKQPGAHSFTISIAPFMDFYKSVETKDVDIMLEVKDKNLSAIKCINCTAGGKTMNTLEAEWRRYKYAVLERSQAEYLKIRALLKDKNAYPAVPFYTHIETALSKPLKQGDALNAAQHVWGYFKKAATANEKAVFYGLIDNYQRGTIPIERVKKWLFRLAVKYGETYLLDALYFSF